MAAALSRDIEVFEYAPRRVKQAITGRGAAAKEQVAAMLGGMLGIEYDPRRLDATDGMAVALCHYFVTSAAARAAGAAGARGMEAQAAVRGGGTAGLRGGNRLNAPQKKVRKSASWEDFVRKNPERELKK
jgi:crossover junction endodeoxyribonuclease RuvC